MAEDFKPVYRCAGPKVEASEEDLHKIIDSLLSGKEKGTVILTDDQVARLKETRDEGTPNLFTIGRTFGLGADHVPFVREDCGADISALIEEVPFDGELHETKCPKCGTVATVKRMPKAASSDERETMSITPEDVGTLQV